MIITNLANQPAHGYSKEQQCSSKQVKPNQRQLGAIRSKVRKIVNDRSRDCCERCGKHKLRCWTLENAHIDGRRTIDHLTNETDLVRLCGPSTESGTCHHWVHATKEGKAWMQKQRERLKQGLLPEKVRMNG